MIVLTEFQRGEKGKVGRSSVFDWQDCVLDNSR